MITFDYGKLNKLNKSCFILPVHFLGILFSPRSNHIFLGDWSQKIGQNGTCQERRRPNLVSDPTFNLFYLLVDSGGRKNNWSIYFRKIDRMFRSMNKDLKDNKRCNVAISQN